MLVMFGSLQKRPIMCAVTEISLLPYDVTRLHTPLAAPATCLHSPAFPAIYLTLRTPRAAPTPCSLPAASSCVPAPAAATARDHDPVDEHSAMFIGGRPTSHAARQTGSERREGILPIGSRVLMPASARLPRHTPHHTLLQTPRHAPDPMHRATRIDRRRARVARPSPLHKYN
jgi:hypothetical protein